MYTVTLKQEQYKTYILSEQTSGSELEVVPERGGIIIGWRVQGQEIFYLDRERFANPDLSVRGGVPILFPICGNLPDNSYNYNEKQYTLKQHGFARDLPWELEEVSENNKTYLKIYLVSNEQTKAVYPFDFHLSFSYKINGNTLEIQQHLHNSSTTSMPFSSGFHPYFLTQDKTQLEFAIPAGEYQDQRTKEIKFFNGNFDFNVDEIDVAFKQLTGKSATVTDNSRKLKLTINYGDDYPIVVFWTLKGKDFYCLEPWSAPRNSLNTGENLTVLEPGDSYQASIRLTANFF
ncbi:aldose epimerase [Nostoc sp. FACHB-152]|uniref:aldose epimerase family protein n=1 Tax=unclassified Nostoc TaxID=2593658 RepID=UPI001682CC4C|nr:MULTISPECIES: aldose epimerase [unclassified Nostoc]MBD2448338.1 aldose epimerase [Nostoc sp. FACHB-152]MBD2467500.1 aldose epimerase [Nostoc sp. FACHB-145]